MLTHACLYTVARYAVCDRASTQQLTFVRSPVKGCVLVDVHMVLVGPLLEEVADHQRLTILGGNQERRAAVVVHRLNRHSLVEELVNHGHMAMDAGPVDRPWPIVIVAVDVQQCSMTKKNLHQLCATP